MNGNEFLLDTNIVLYLLEGDKTIGNFLNNKTIYLSFITEMELKSFPGLEASQEIIIDEFLSDCISFVHYTT